MPSSSETPGLPHIRPLVMALAERRHALDEPDPHGALSAARAVTGDDESVLTAWATAHPARVEIEHALTRVRAVAIVVIASVMIIAAVGGYGAAATALATAPATAPSGLVNVPAVLGAVVALPTVALLLWVLASVALPRLAARLSIGAAVDWLVARVHALIGRAVGRGVNGTRDPVAVSRRVALDAWRRRELSPSVARWSLGAMTHAVWLSFAVGALAGLLVTFALRERQFCWESTILSAAQWERLVAGIGWLPTQLGVSVPDSGQVAMSRFSPAQPELFPTQDDETRRAWAGLLLSAITIYTFAPRALLLAVCAWRRGTALRRLGLPLREPPLAPLLRTLRTDHERGSRREAPMPDPPFAGGAQDEAAAVESSGPPAIVGIEIAAPPEGWPPPAASDATDLGIIELSRDARQSVVDRLRAASPPARLIVFVALTAVADRGVAAMLGELMAAARCRLRLVLTAGEALRRRGDGAAVARRVEAWRALASQLGVQSAEVLEIDLDTMTSRSAASLRGAITGRDDAGGAASSTRQVELAFALIDAAAVRWCAARDADGPTIADRTALAAEIARLHGGKSTLSTRIGLPSLELLQGNPAEALRDAAARVTGLLPASLHLRPRWIAAGGMAGALACVGVALATGPIGVGAALLASPYLAAVGAIAGQLLAPVSTTSSGISPDADAHGLAIGDAVAAATLHALLLELQGLPERSITKVLESTLDRDDPPSLPDSASARRWLDDIRHRFDLAQADPALVAESAR